MTRKEAINQILSKVPEEKKKALVKEVTACRDLAEKANVLEQYGISLTAEEQEAFRSSRLRDEEIADAAGGCSCDASCFPCAKMGVNY